MNGWTLLYRTVERDIETKSDVLVAVVHLQLLRFGVKCIGVGEDQTLSELDEESELLPDGWNLNKTSYALRYKYQNEVFILLGTVVDDAIVLNLLNGKSFEVSNATFLLQTTVAALKGQLPDMIPDIDTVTDRLQKELIQPILSSNEKTSETQTTPEVDPSVSYPPIPNLRDDRHENRNFLRDLNNYGTADLDPFGGAGGGMLFNPSGLRNPQNFGMPEVIPGSRFDPFNPPEVERQQRNGRDFDHFRPPGGSGSNFHDDMFM